MTSMGVTSKAGTDALRAYLTDHLAGSAGALDLLGSLDGERDDEFHVAIRSLRDEIAQDRQTLVEMMDAMEVDESAVKQAGSRVGEKLFRLWSSATLTRSLPLTRLMRLEALQAGVAGKAAGWRALDALADERLRGFDFTDLLARADDQHARLEQLRIAAATAAFSA